MSIRRPLFVIAAFVLLLTGVHLLNARSAAAPFPVDLAVSTTPSPPPTPTGAAFTDTLGRVVLWDNTTLWNDTALWNDTVAQNNAAEAARQATARRAARHATASHSSAASYGSGACGGNLPPCWVMMRESGGNIHAYNPTGCGGEGCNGKWQCDPRSCNGTGSEAEQDASAAALWDGGRGCSNWNAC